VSQLVLGIQEAELSLKRICASTLGEIAKHEIELAQVVVDAGAVPLLAPLIQHSDSKLKAQVCLCLSHIAKHHVDMAEVVVEAEIFPKIFVCLKDSDPNVRKHAATCIREVARHTPELSQMVVNSGGHVALIDYVTKSTGAARLPGIMTLGYIGAFSETLARAIIQKQGIVPIKDALVNEKEDHIKAAAAWSLSQLGKHSPEHAEALALLDVFRVLIDAYKRPDASADQKSKAAPSDLKTKAARALKLVIQKCTYLAALDPLLKDAPDKIMRYVVRQYAKVLPNSVKAKKDFLQTKGLQRVLEMKSDSKDQKLQTYIAQIAALYPPDIVDHYSPRFDEHAIKRIEALEGGMASMSLGSVSAAAPVAAAAAPSGSAGGSGPAPAADGHVAPAKVGRAKS